MAGDGEPTANSAIINVESVESSERAPPRQPRRAHKKPAPTQKHPPPERDNAARQNKTTTTTYFCDESRLPRASRSYRDSSPIPRFDLKLHRMRPSIYHMAFDRSPETCRAVSLKKRRASCKLHEYFKGHYRKVINL